MRRCTDPLALDPLSPIGIGPIADIASTTDPLALEPLSPLSAGARPTDAGFVAADAASMIRPAVVPGWATGTACDAPGISIVRWARAR